MGNSSLFSEANKNVFLSGKKMSSWSVWNPKTATQGIEWKRNWWIFSIQAEINIKKAGFVKYLKYPTHY